MKNLLILCFVISNVNTFSCDEPNESLSLKQIKGPEFRIKLTKKKPFRPSFSGGALYENKTMKLESGFYLLGKNYFFFSPLWIKKDKKNRILIKGTDGDFITMKKNNSQINTVGNFNRKYGKDLKICFR